MMIRGVHTILYSTNADADRCFFRDVLGLPSVDAGDGWLIFAPPPAEMGIHPSSGSSHELYFMCDDITAFCEAMRDKGIEITSPEDQGWGILTRITLPSGAMLGVYQPKHPSPQS